MYQTPKLERLGDLRTLTQYGWGQGTDTLGLWLTDNGINTSGNDGCSTGYTGVLGELVNCRGSG